MAVHVGQRAPDFDLASDAGNRMSLADFDGKWLVLYFYPRDNTPGCTLQARGFTAASARADELGAAVAGVSRDSVNSHGKFRDKYAIGFPLLSDPDLTAHAAYGAWGKKKMYGREVEGTIRSTFLIAPDGTVARVWTGVRVNGHADAVFDAIGQATRDGPARSGGATVPKGVAPGKAAAPVAKNAAKRAATKTTAKRAPTSAKKARSK